MSRPCKMQIQNPEPMRHTSEEMYHPVGAAELEKFLLSDPIEKHMTRTDSALEIAEAILARFRVFALVLQENNS